MPIDPLPSISRSDANFRAQVDDYFLTRLPAFSTQAEVARAQIVAAESTATSAASSAAADANNASIAASSASTDADDALVAKNLAVTAKNSAEVAAAQAVSGNVATPIHEATSKTTPVDADELGLSDSAAAWGLKKLTFANLKAWISGLFFSKTGDTIDGNLSFSGLTRYISGELNGSTNGIYFRHASPYFNSYIGVMPSTVDPGSAGLRMINKGALSANMSYAEVSITPSYMSIDAGRFGTGTYLPIVFRTSDVERMRIDTSGNVLSTGGALGYGVGSGGTVTQVTSKSTSVTLNKPSGVITMHNASLAAGASVAFLLSCSYASAPVGATTTVSVINGSVGSGLNYRAEAVSTTSGGVYIRLTNVSAGALAEAVQIQFNTHAGAST